ncbi:MAG: hypothetical protein WCW52_01140 [Elusimicrobiales bacterium]
MKTIIFVAAFVCLAFPAGAFELQSLRAADIKTAGAPVPPAAAAAPEEKQLQELRMNIYGSPSWQETEAEDNTAGIDVRVRKVFDRLFSVDSRVETIGERSNINKSGVNFQFSCSAADLRMDDYGGSYGISGSVVGEHGQTGRIALDLYKGFDGYSFSVSGTGLNMSVTRSGISGNYDGKHYSKKAVAAVVALILAVQVDKTPVR